MLFANSRVPIYRQLYQQLRTAINEGDLEVGRKLPSERRLAVENGISRMTARKAIALLECDGLVRAYQGRGCFVAKRPSAVSSRTLLAGLAPSAVQVKVPAESRLLSCSLVPAETQVAHHLRVPASEQIICVRRLRLTEDKPFGLQTAFLPYPLCAPLMEMDLEQLSLHRALETHLNIRLAYSNQTIQTTLGDDADLPLLGLTPPSAVLQVLRETFDTMGCPIAFINLICRSDMVAQDTAYV